MIDIYLCDDDEQICRRVREALEKKILMEEYDMRTECSAGSAEELLGSLKEKRPNIYFLDVELGERHWDGFRLGREIRRRDPGGILVYLTGYKDLAFRTFEYHLEAFDYIVKRPERLESDISRVLEAIQERLIRQRRSPDQVYTLRVGNTLRHIPVEEILFFETASRPHHVLLHTRTGRIDFAGNLGEIERELGERFFRTHRAYLVALDRIEESDFGRGRLRVGGQECPVARSARGRLARTLRAQGRSAGRDCPA